MNSMKIGTYQMDTSFGLYLPEYTIPAPTPQTHFVQIIGRDGSVDLSEAIGLHYDSRVWDLDFKCFDPTVNWHTLTSHVMNAIHGKRLNFEFDDDPNYFWTGRISVSSYVSTRGTGTLKINITSDPFKYAKLSTIVTKNASTGTDYTGALVSFNTANAKINDLSVTMQPIQDLHGYDSPWPAGGGVNKFYCSNNATATAHGVTCSFDASTQTFTVGGTNDSSSAYILLGIIPTAEIVRNTPISRGFIGAPSGIYVNFVWYDGSWHGVNNGDTIPDSVELRNIRLQIGVYGNATTIPLTAFKFQLQEGSTAPTSWSPYSNICPISGRTGLSVYVGPTQDQQDATTYAVDWTTEAGTVYGGTLDVVTGVLTVDKGYVDMGSLSWSRNATYNVMYAYVTGKANGRGNLICSNYKTVELYYEYLSSGEISGALNNNAINVKDDAYTSAADFKTAMNGVQLVYTLATPLTYQLTPQEVTTLVGQNNVWSDSGDVSVTVVTPETLTNNGRAVVPTLTASADMVLKWGNYSASVQQGTSTVPQLILENGANLIYIIGTGTLSFTWQEASL